MGEESLTTFILLGTIIVIFFVAFVVLLSYMFTAKKNKLIQEKQLMKTQFEQELLQTQVEIQEQTLNTISEEIHDNVGQILSLAKLNLNTVKEIINPQTRLKIENAREMVSKAINDLRDLSRSLQGEKAGEIGLVEAITNELKVLQNTGQYNTQLKIEGQLYKLDPKKEMVLFRIVQEALHNAVKHANASELKVFLNYSPLIFSLQVCDNGVGFSQNSLQASKTGIGLQNMQNRTALIGGDFNIESSKSCGTSIRVEIANNKP